MCVSLSLDATCRWEIVMLNRNRMRARGLGSTEMSVRQLLRPIMSIRDRVPQDEARACPSSLDNYGEIAERLENLLSRAHFSVSLPVGG